MSNALTRQIQYMAETLGPRAIARQTGVPYTSVWRAINRDAAVNTAYRSSVRSAYGKTAYRNLQATGMSNNQANRFRTYSPEAVREVTRRMAVITDELIEGVYLIQKRSLDERGLYYTEDTLRAISKNALIEGLQASGKTIEEWEAYL